jgi:hypothetical protein
MVENCSPARLLAHILLLQTMRFERATSGPNIGDLGDRRRGKRSSLYFGASDDLLFLSNAHTLATAAVTERVDELLFRCDSNLAGEAYSKEGRRRRT